MNVQIARVLEVVRTRNWEKKSKKKKLPDTDRERYEGVTEGIWKIFSPTFLKIKKNMFEIYICIVASTMVFESVCKPWCRMKKKTTK